MPEPGGRLLRKSLGEAGGDSCLWAGVPTLSGGVSSCCRSPLVEVRALVSTLRVWLETRDSSTSSDPVDVKSSLCPPSFWTPSPLQSEDSAFSNNREKVVEFFTVCLNQDLCSPGPERREARGDASH